MSVEELKHIVNSESDTHLTLFFVPEFDDPTIEGFATMPWETDAFGVLGNCERYSVGYVFGVKNVMIPVINIAVLMQCYTL